ncbi:MAG TPA: DMT family transporter [Bacillota bacterium]|nr:DMT family transporter [Bacillota bacterium]
MWLLAALGTTFCFGINNSIFKWSATRGLSKISIQFFFYMVASLLITGYGLYRHQFHFSGWAVLLGAAAGILNANGNIQMTKAFEKGPAGITSTLIAMNAIIPVLASGILFPEPIPPLHWLGVILMVMAAAIVQFQPNRNNQVEYRTWLVRIALALLSIGSCAVILKITAFYQISFANYLLFFYSGGFVYLALRMMKQEIHLIEVKVGSMVGILSVIGFGCYLYALASGPASVVFPVISLNCLVVMGTGLLLFNEKIRWYQAIGILVALSGLVLTKI